MPELLQNRYVFANVLKTIILIFFYFTKLSKIFSVHFVNIRKVGGSVMKGLPAALYGTLSKCTANLSQLRVRVLKPGVISELLSGSVYSICTSASTSSSGANEEVNIASSTKDEREGR